MSWLELLKLNVLSDLNVFHKDVDIEAVACVRNLQYRMMLPPGLQVYLRPRVILIFDLLNPHNWSLLFLPMDHLCQFASKSVNSFSKYRVQNVITDEQTDEQTDGRTDRRTDGQVEKIMPPPGGDIKVAVNTSGFYPYAWWAQPAPSEKYH